MSAQPPPKGKIIVSGILFWFPLAGVTYQFLHYLLGLRRLGYDPYYIEDSSRWVFDPDLNYVTHDAGKNVGAVAPILEAYGFQGRWAFRGAYEGGRCYGMSELEIAQMYRDADALLNVTGAQELREEHMAIPRRIYVETDPVASQIKVTQGDPKILQLLSGHDCHFSFGENFGRPDCRVPLERFQWQTTRQPVALDLWDQVFQDRGGAYTTIGIWKHRHNEVVYQGETYYWSKDREFYRFIDLPRRRTAPFELATQVEDDVRAVLEANGWGIHDPYRISGDCELYRSYIQNSRAEFTVAKDQNIRLRSGWFSDRSACYLAAGRPVVTQDTAFSAALPTGRGLYSFQTMEEILGAVDSIESDYEGNCRAAREIAAEYFDAEKVLGSLMRRAGL
jgi:hypothetical protein